MGVETTDGRIEAFSRNGQLERLLAELNGDLWPAEETLLRRVGTELPYPPILIMGPLRSGSTLFMQWLANTGLAAYPTNLLSRFYKAPILGAKIQLLLTDQRFNFRNEFEEFSGELEYRSENGKTQGALAPNEFWYFWRRFLPMHDCDVWSDRELKEGMDGGFLRKEIGGLMEVFDKPFAAKAMLFNYNIRVLDDILEKAIFIHIRRNEATNVASALEARRRQMGDEAAWYSFEIPEYGQLQRLDPVPQVLGQIRSINRAVSEGLENVDQVRKLTVQYEDFCADPEAIYRELSDRLEQQGVDATSDYVGPASFVETRSTVDPRIKAAIREA